MIPPVLFAWRYSVGWPYPRWCNYNLILDLFYAFLLSDRESPRLVRNMEVELVMKPWHPTSKEIRSLSTHFWHIVLADPHIFSTYTDVPSQNFPQKGLLTQERKLFNLTNQMTISGRQVLTLFLLKIRNRVLNQSRRASTCSHRAMMVCSYFDSKVSKSFLL